MFPMFIEKERGQVFQLSELSRFAKRAKFCEMGKLKSCPKIQNLEVLHSGFFASSASFELFDFWQILKFLRIPDFWPD